MAALDSINRIFPESLESISPVSGVRKRGSLNAESATTNRNVFLTVHRSKVLTPDSRLQDFRKGSGLGLWFDVEIRKHNRDGVHIVSRRNGAVGVIVIVQHN
jgi:hypothetical protein